MMIPCRNSLIICVRHYSDVLLQSGTGISHHLVATKFQKDFLSLFYDIQPMFEDAETAWTSWDDKLDSDVMTKIVDEQQQLAQGIIKPDEFIKTCDSLVKK